MRTTRHDHDAVLITNAQRSMDDELRERKKIYTILMIIHLLGFTAAGVLAAVSQLWWLALALAVTTGVLPWVAVVLANDRRLSRDERRAENPSQRSPSRVNGQYRTRHPGSESD